MTLWTDIMTSQPIFQNTFILRRPGVAIFADIIKIVTTFIKTIFKDSRKVKIISNYLSECNLYLYFLILSNLLIFGEKNAGCKQNSRGVPRDSYIFWIFFS